MVYVFFIHFISLQWLRLLHCPLQSAFHTFVYIQKFRHEWYQQVEHHSVEKQDFFSSFDYKIFRESSFQCQCTVWKKEKFTAMPRNFFSSNQFGTRFISLALSKTVSLTEFLLQNRDRKFRNFDSLSVTWKNEKFTLTEKIFRQIKSFVTLVKPLLSRNLCQKSISEFP